MDDQTAKIVAQTIANLTEVAARNTIGAVSDKVKSAKAGRDKDKTIAELEDLVNQVVNDKIELERIAKTLENELVSQKISQDDINFIVDSVIPLAKEIVGDKPKEQESLKALEKVLSVEVLQVVQLIGFNYREAVGAPLTKLCATAILNMGDSESKHQTQQISLQNQTAIAELSKNRQAYNRFVKVMGLEKLADNSEDDDSAKNQ